MTPLGRPWPALILASCAAVALSTWLEATQAVRTVSTFWFFLTCPGLAVVGALGIRDRLAEGLLAVALSLALGTAVAVFMVLVRVWSPDAGLAVLIGFSLLGGALQVVLRARGSLAPPAAPRLFE